MIKCFFHSADLDGHCSGAIVKYKFPETELFPIDYGEIFPFDKISKDDTIYMVDFSLPIIDMIILSDIVGFNKLFWIDHHISSINDANKTDFNKDCLGKREVGKAACELTWEYLYPDEPSPWAITLLGRYDVWDLQENVLEFQYGMRLNNTWPHNQELWREVFDIYADELIIDTIEQGKTILKYQKQENEKYIKAAAFELTFAGYKAIAVNKMLTSSQLFESIWDNEKYDIMITFGMRKTGDWTMSFYTDKEGIDVSIIAKRFGGGGHKNAAGCSFKELPIGKNFGG
jgi:oligoribonuclease NrnB/cAMP/cGMP phosphodiesterase (DHH superfamily)